MDTAQRPTDTRHDADEVVGRITIRRTWDRRYKIVHPPPEPVPYTLADALSAFAGVFVILFLFVALFVLWPYL